MDTPNCDEYDRHLFRLGLCLMSALHTELITDYRRSVIFSYLCLISLESFFTAVSCKKLLMETEIFSWNLIKRYVHIPRNAIIPIFLFISNHICLVFSLPLIFAPIKVVPNEKGPGSGKLPHFHPRTTFYSVQFTYFC